MKSINNVLPQGWVWTRINDICNLINGRAFKPTEWASKGLPIVRIQNLNNEAAEFNYCDFRVDDKYIINRGQLLFAWSGTPGTSFGAHIWKKEKAVLNQHIFRVEINESNVDKIYLMYLLNRNVDEYIRKAHGTAGLAHITKGKFGNSIVPIAPLPIQKLIVSEIEKQFSRLDEAVAALKRVRASLKRYKASVLKAAVEGKLTEEWREKNVGAVPCACPDLNKGQPKVEGQPQGVAPTETGADLLKRILAERKKKWEEKNPKKKYKEPSAPDTSTLPELPKGWVWATVGQLAVKVQYGSSAKMNENPSGVPVLRMGNIFEGRLKREGLKYLPKSHSEFPDLFLEKEDLLFNRTNSPELVGKTAVYMGNPNPCSFASYLIRVQFNNGANSHFVSSFINSVYGRNWIKTVVSQQVGQANVNGTKLQALLIPLPPAKEQKVIVEEIESRLSVAEEIEEVIDINLKRAERLRQAILKKAFSGMLLIEKNKVACEKKGGLYG